MKKRCINRLICLLLLSLIGCSSSASTPEEVAVNYVKGLAQQNFDEMDKYSAVEYETIHRAMIEQIMQQSSKSETEIYEMALEGEDVETIPTNYEEYKEIFITLFKEKLKKEYGENYSIEASVISFDDMNPDDKNELLEEASDYYDRYGIIISDIINFGAIEESKKIQCKAYIKGEGEKQTTEDFSVYVVNINDEWKVLNLGVGA